MAVTFGLLTTLPVLAASATPAGRVGWWNYAGVGAATAPSPTTPTGGIRIAATLTQVTAYGALLLSVGQATEATVRLQVASGHGAPSVQACPTVGSTWTAGDDQPYAEAPRYDCTTEHHPAVRSADGASLTFTLTHLTAGTVSLAIVPDLSSSTVFDVDIEAPGNDALLLPNAAPTTVAPPTTWTPTFVPPALPAALLPVASAGASVPLAQGATAPLTAVPPAAVAAQPPAAEASPPQVSRPASWRGRLGSTLGMLTLAVVLLLWATGRGVLGGRINPLSVPLTSGSAAAPEPQP